MPKREDHQTPGEYIYELLAREDRTSRYWPEWRDLSGEDKERYENAAIRFYEWLREDQESYDK